MQYRLLILILSLSRLVRAEFNGGVDDEFNSSSKAELDYAYVGIQKSCRATVTTAKIEVLSQFSNKWMLNWHVDIPYVWLHCKQPYLDIWFDADDNPHTSLVKFTNKINGLANVSGEVFFISPPLKQWHVGVGTQFYFPTATNHDLAPGKYSNKSSVGIQYHPPHWKNDSWLALLIKYQFSFATRYQGPDIRILFLVPTWEISLPEQWSLSFAPEILLNCVDRTWFIPFNVEFGKTISERIAISFVYNRGIVKDFFIYTQKAEFHFNILF